MYSKIVSVAAVLAGLSFWNFAIDSSIQKPEISDVKKRSWLLSAGIPKGLLSESEQCFDVLGKSVFLKHPDKSLSDNPQIGPYIAEKCGCLVKRAKLDYGSEAGEVLYAVNHTLDFAYKREVSKNKNDTAALVASFIETMGDQYSGAEIRLMNERSSSVFRHCNK